MDVLPLFLDVSGRQVIIIGDGDAADAKARLVVAAGGRVVDEAADAPMLAFVAYDEDDTAAAAAARLRARGLLVNVVDKPAMSDFLMGAIIDRSPVVVAISTGGASASLSRALRGRLEALLPASLGGLARAIAGSRRAVSAVHATIADRRRLWERVLAEGAALDPFRPLADPDAALAAAIAGQGAAEQTETRHIMVQSDDPGELTLNDLAALGRCDTLVVLGAVPPTVVDRARRDALRLATLPVPPPPGLSVVLQASNSVSQ